MTPTKIFKPTRAYTLAKDLDSNTLEQLLYHIRSNAGALILELELALIDKGEAASRGTRKPMPDPKKSDR